jgi:nucleotide-binding universal stress UspA family protein
MNYRKILVAVDFSDLSRTALREAAALATRHEAELTIAHVREGLSLRSLLRKPVDDRAMPSQLALEDQLMCEWHDDAVRETQRPVHTLQLEGAPADAIVRQARESDCDLVVLGARGAGGRSSSVLGSVCAKVAASASCPVLVVRARDRR